MDTGQAVLVTTKFRGVFFGRLVEDIHLPEEITLSDARNCIYWSADINGFLGLADTGPDKSCKIGARVASLRLFSVTSITPCTEEAVTAWMSA